MTEEQARRAKLLVEELDNIRRLPDGLEALYRKATVDGDRDAIEKITNIAFELCRELIKYVERDIAAV